MAKKRMFNGQVLDTDAFLELPLSAQALYFHLNLRADDDGFISNPKRVQNYIGASEDDLKLLVLKRFLITFPDGVMVVKHWRMHNTIQKDRYTPTDYQDDLALLGIKSNKAYTLDGNQMDTKCIQNVSTDIGIDIDIDTDKDSDIDSDIVPVKKKAKIKTHTVYYPNDEVLNKAFEDFVAHRKAIKKPMTEKAISLQMNKLDELSKGDNDLAVKIINQTIMNGWQGLFELKVERTQYSKPASDIEGWFNA